MNFLRFFIPFIAVFLLASCGNPAKPEPQVKISQKPKISINSTTVKKKTLFDPSLSGLYEGNLPCSDCPVIKASLRLSKNGTYLLIEKYQKDGQNLAVKMTGSWLLDESTVRLLRKDGSVDLSFLVKADNSLSILDPEELEMPESLGFMLKKAE